jgi:hypothetical protein
MGIVLTASQPEYLDALTMRCARVSAMVYFMKPPSSSGVLGRMHTHSGLKILEPHSGMLRAWHDSAAH